MMVYILHSYIDGFSKVCDQCLCDYTPLNEYGISFESCKEKCKNSSIECKGIQYWLLPQRLCSVCGTPFSTSNHPKYRVVVYRLGRKNYYM